MKPMIPVTASSPQPRAVEPASRDAGDRMPSVALVSRFVRSGKVGLSLFLSLTVASVLRAAPLLEKMDLFEENQAVTAPSPWPITLTVPVGSTVATLSSVDVNRAQWVTSRDDPSL